MSWLQIGNLSESEATKNMLESMKVLDHCCLNWHVELEPGMALEWAKETEGYNGHDTQNLINIISGINKLAPTIYFRPDHPANGGYHHKFHIGNESSRVIYLVIRKVYTVDGFSYQQLTETLDEIVFANNADEQGVVRDDHVFKYRIWFD